MSAEALLATRDLTVRFGGVTAVDALSIDVEEGSLTGLIGPNGAGKTTAIDAISGLVRASGDIQLAGTSVMRWPPHKRSRAGIGRTFQSLELFDEFTVEENLLVPADAHRRFASLMDLIRPNAYRHALPDVERTLATVGLTDLSDAHPNELSLGERKLVSIARAVCGGSRLVLLDEPAAGLNSDDTLALGEKLKGLVRSGITILLIDHDMSLVLSICDVIHVLVFGKLVASGTPDEIRKDERVIEAYLGDQEDAEELSEAEAAR